MTSVAVVGSGIAGLTAAYPTTHRHERTLFESDDRMTCNGLERGQMEIVFRFRMAVLMTFARVLPVRAWAKLLGRAVR
jgi:phytoene dehydrogenase-like protein